MRENAMPDDMRDLWQNQELDAVTITLPEIRRRADRFRRRIQARNLREYTVGIVVIALQMAMLWRSRGWYLAAPILLIAGSAYVLYQIHKRASGRTTPTDAGLRASVEFYRQELERQRDALRAVWRWYLLPLVPGILAAYVGAAVTRGFSVGYLVRVGFTVCVFAAVWALNLWAARRLDGKIRELSDGEQDE
jgi:hypothetical protein